MRKDELAYIKSFWANEGMRNAVRKAITQKLTNTTTEENWVLNVPTRLGDREYAHTVKAIVAGLKELANAFDTMEEMAREPKPAPKMRE